MDQDVNKYKLTPQEIEAAELLFTEFTAFKQKNKDYLKKHGDVAKLVLFMLKFRLL